MKSLDDDDVKESNSITQKSKSSPSHKFSNGIHRCQIQFPIVHIVITGYSDDLLSSNLTPFVIPACHVNFTATTGQFDGRFFSNARIAAGYDHHFSIDANAAFVLTALDPFPVNRNEP